MLFEAQPNRAHTDNNDDLDGPVMFASARVAVTVVNFASWFFLCLCTSIFMETGEEQVTGFAIRRDPTNV